MLAKENIKYIYTSTPMQEGMFFHSLMDKSSVYFEQVSYRLQGRLDIQLIEKSLHELFKRHDILRTVFVQKGANRLLQVVLKEREACFYYEDISSRSDKEEYLREYNGQDRKNLFDLSKDVLMRLAVFRMNEDEYAFTWSHHHILMDGWCTGVLIAEFFEIYHSLLENRARRLSPAGQYRDYIKWLEQQDRRASQDYWKRYLQFYEEAVHIPREKISASNRAEQYKLERVRFSLSENRTRALEQLAGKNNVTLNTLMQTAWGVLLGKYNCTRDAVFGAVVSVRPGQIPGIEQMIGLFINTIPVRISFAEEVRFDELLREVQEAAIAGELHYYFPLAEIQAESILKQNLFDHIFAFENFPTAVQIEDSARTDDAAIEDDEDDGRTHAFRLELTHVEAFEQTNYDFNVIISPSKQLDIRFEYNGNIYDTESVKRAAQHFNEVLARFQANEKIDVDELNLLSAAEKEQLLVAFNDTQADYPQGKTIHRLFAEQADRTPDSTAVMLNGEAAVSGSVRSRSMLTYRQLAEKARRLACILQAEGVYPGSIVGLLLESSIETIAGIIAVLYAGAAYLPIDPYYPQERRQYILSDSSTEVLLTSRRLFEKIDKPDNWQGKPIFIEDALADLKDQAAAELLPGTVSPVDPAYIIYTSGTTGKPKGVMIEHRNVVRLMFNDRFLFDFNERDVWTMFHSYCFDFSVWEMYGALLYGGKLILIPRMTARDTRSFFEILLEEKVTVLNQTPSAFYNLIGESVRQKKQLAVRYVIFGGEALAPLKLAAWREQYPAIKLINMFGITETTVHVTYKEIGDREIATNMSNIGKPLPTLSTYVLDPQQALVPLGAAGELGVGGAGVGRGYLNKPELTTEKFVFNNMSYESYTSDGSHIFDKLYKSGDLVRLTKDGEMEYLGRIDHQVQIRGYRVELGEIESRLLKYPGIKDAVAMAGGDADDNKYLAAYITPVDPARSAEIVDTAALREYLSRTLPDYMLPNYFVAVDKIPLTANGKIDRKSLPDPGAGPREEYIPPRNELETKIVEIWQKTLELERVGITDNFFYIGGDSIKAIRLLSVLNTELKTNLKIVDLFTNETIEKLSGTLQQDTSAYSTDELMEAEKEIAELKNKIIAQYNLPPDIEDIYPMSDIEKGMVFHSMKEQAGAVYHDQVIYQVMYNEFDPRRLQQAVALLIEKHPILRTCFDVDNYEQPMQLVFKKIEPDIAHYDISHLENQEQEKYINDFSFKDRRNPFNISQPPLWRFRTFSRSAGNIVVLFVCHHAIIDGWSEASFMTELNNTYLRLKTEPDYIPGKLKNSYKRFIIEQMAEKRRTLVIDFWKNELDGYKRFIFPHAGERPGETRAMNGFSTDLGSPRYNGLNLSARRYNTTLKNLCIAAYVYMLYMISYEDDLTVGVVTNNRPICEDADRILGCFLNTIPVRIKIPRDENLKWSDYIRLIDNKMLELTKYDRLSLFEIAKIVGAETREQNPIFDTLFNLVDFHVFKQAIQDDVPDNVPEDAGNAPLFLQENVTTNTLFNFGIRSTPGRFAVSFSYSRSLFDKEVEQHLYHYFKTILDKFIAEPETPVSKEGLIYIEEREKLLFRLNDTAVEYPQDKTIARLFVEQAARTPHRIALFSRRAHVLPLTDVHLTYGELSARSDILGHALQEAGIAADDIVCIMMERSLEMLIGIMGILKAGGAYCPIDIDSPAPRKQFILTDSRAKVLLSAPGLNEALSIGSKENRHDDLFRQVRGTIFIEVSPINTETNEEAFTVPNRQSGGRAVQTAPVNLQDAAAPANLCYVLYTSGSTGKPKGVMVEQRNVNNLVVGLRKRIYDSYDRELKVALVAPFIFDASVKQIFAALLLGHSLYIASEETRLDGIKLSAFYLKHGIDISDAAPAHLAVLLESVTGRDARLAVKHFIIGGEPLPRKIVKDFLNTFDPGGLRITNVYGPTECCVDSTSYEVDPEHLDDFEIVPIGTPLANQQVYILDAALRLQPYGIAGELCIAGDNVSRGYMRQPELTAEKFVFNNGSYKSYRTYASEKLYKTGDLARWRPDGNLEFLGRLDQQVKVRGFRIELGEIESCLLEHEAVKQAAAVMVYVEEQVSGNKEMNGSICAYFVPGKELEPAALRDYLSSRLPAYMIPAYFVELPEMPLTANGKIDRKALPSPQEAALDGSALYAAARNPIEEKLTAIWQAVLGREKIGIHDNFFLLGGDSIKSIQISARMGKSGYQIEMRDLFNNPTIAQLAPLIKKRERVPDQSIVSGIVPLTPIQEDFFHRSRIAIHHFNHSLMLFSREGFGEEATRAVFKKILEHHDALRLVFIEENGSIIQRNCGLECPLSLDTYDFRGCREAVKELEIKANEIQKGIDLARGPLLKLGLFHLDDGDRLLIVIHHLVIDGISWRVLLEDIDTLYAQYKAGTTLALPLKTDSFKEWAEKLRLYADSETFLKELDYWREVENAQVSMIEKDFAGLQNDVKDALSESFFLDEEKTELLLTRVNDAFGTEINDILLTALGLAMKQYRGFDKLLVALEGHGREEILKDMDITRTVGWFTSVYPVILDFSHEQDLSFQVKKVKESLRLVPNKGIGHGILEYLTAKEYKKEIEFNLKPQVSFNYLGQFDADVAERAFKIAGESRGYEQDLNRQREYEFDILGMISDKRLRISIIYNKTHYKRENIRKLLDFYCDELVRIILFCTSREFKEFTPSDFDMKQLSIDDIDTIDKIFAE